MCIKALTLTLMGALQNADQSFSISSTFHKEPKPNPNPNPNSNATLTLTLALTLTLTLTLTLIGALTLPDPQKKRQMYATDFLTQKGRTKVLN